MQQHIKDLIEKTHTLLNHYRELEHTQFTNNKERDSQTHLERLTLSRTIHNRQAEIYWAEEVLAELEEIDSAERN